MVMDDELDDALNVLACEYEKRPKGAPSFFDLRGSIRGMHRTPETLRIDFDPAEAAVVRQLVEAERLCCGGIGWDLRERSSLTLSIQATPEQLDVFEQVLRVEHVARSPRVGAPIP